MSEQPSTSLRVRFALARGWTVNGSTNTQPDGKMYQAPGSPWPLKLVDSACLPPIDANTVREALMGMTPAERKLFSQKIYGLVCGHSIGYRMVDQLLFETPPTTLAEIYCEVRNVP